MSDLNKVLLSGRLTADPELRQTADSTMVCNFTVASNRRNINGESIAEFINVVTWRGTAEFVSRNFHKGKMIIVEGSLRNRIYANKKHPNVRHKVTSVYADEVYFAGDKKERSELPVAVNLDSQIDLSEFEEVTSDNDLPF